MDIQKIEKEIDSLIIRSNNPHVSEAEKSVLKKRIQKLAAERNDLHGVERPAISIWNSESWDSYAKDIRVKRWDSPIFDEYSTLRALKPEPEKPIVMVDIPDYNEAPDNFKPHEFQWSENKTPREIRAMGSEFAMFQLIGKKW